jgi:photosystem II stability/assembly factor-like uncharacterized protein
MNRLLAIGLVLVLAVAARTGAAVERQAVADPLERAALELRTPDRGFFLALVETGGPNSRLVAAGERGLIVFSDDAGKTWRQARVPVAVTLTALAFPSPTEGWAVGHGGVVLHTRDSGESWRKQLDGPTAARLADAAAGDDPALKKRTAQLLADGADKPFLAVHFDDPQHGFVVGAYGLIFGTENGGKSWQSWLDRVDNPRGLHLNAIAATGSSRYLVGEQGLLLRSADGSKHFSQLETPYAGSFFTVLAAGETVIVGGLKGNAFRSADGGANWTKVTGLPPVNLLFAHGLSDGGFLFVNQGGRLLVNAPGSLAWHPVLLPPGALPALAALQVGDGSWVVAGQRGIGRSSTYR